MKIPQLIQKTWNSFLYFIGRKKNKPEQIMETYSPDSSRLDATPPQSGRSSAFTLGTRGSILFSRTPTNSSLIQDNQRTSDLIAQYVRETGNTLFSLDIREAHTHTKIPLDFLGNLLSFNKKTGLFLSARVQDANERANRRYSLLQHDLDPKLPKIPAMAAKDTAYASKSTPIDCIGSGYIGEDWHFRNDGKVYNLLDNNKKGTFPKRAKLDRTALDFLREHDSQDILEVRKIGSLICYKKVVDAYFKDPVGVYHKNGVNLEKYYIQITETFGSIVARLDTQDTANSQPKVYTFIKANAGKVYFQDRLANVIMIDLKLIIPKKTKKAAAGLNVDNITNLQEFKDFVATHKLFKLHVPLFRQKSPEEQEVFLPVMAHTGDNGFAISGDVDMQHIAMINGLPSVAHNTYISKNARPHHILRDLCALEEELAAPQYAHEPFIGLRKDTAHTVEYYVKNMERLKTIGTSSIYSLVQQHRFLRQVIRNNANDLWLHAGDDTNPGAAPEAFKGILSLWKAKFYISADEESYLSLLLSDRDILKDEEIGVHPAWVLAHQADNSRIDLAKCWLDTIAIHALNLYNSDNGLEKADKYIDDLGRRICGVESRYDVNQQAMIVIRNYVLTIIYELDRVNSTRQDVSNKIDALYEKYSVILREPIPEYSRGFTTRLRMA
jgi:hypothetical protein